MRNHVVFALVIGCLLAAVSGDAAQESPRLDSRVTRAALFKNGLGFFVREAALPAAADISLGPFAAPAHGTFWISYPQGVKIAGLVARQSTATEQVPVISVAELLRANVGREVVITPTWQDAEPITGRLLSVADDREEAPPDSYAWGRGPSDETRARWGASPSDSRNPQGRLALLETVDGVVGLDPNMVRQVIVRGGPPVSTLTRETKAWEVHVRLDRPAPGAAITASYLAKGITWAPSYVVDISDPSTARVTAKAEIMNEAENLDGVRVDLVTGFPNLRFADIVSPLAGKETLAGFLAALARGASQRDRAVAAVMAQSLARGYGGYADLRGDLGAGVMPEYGAAAAGVGVEDLFLYPLERVTLAKGEIAYCPLFSASVPYTEVYQWEIPDYVNEEDRYGDQRREQQQTQEQVWHSIKLVNQTKLPWTTAPAQTIKSGQILGQDTLDYTSPGTDSILKITRAMGVKAEQAEFETTRERAAAQYYGYAYDRLTISGRLRAVNHKDEPINLEVVKTLSGEVKQTAPEAKVEQLARGLKRMNPLSVLSWNFQLQPGEEKELTYTYEALIRR